MNIINVKINFEKGTNIITGNDLITGDYASTKIKFDFDNQEGVKIFELKNPSGSIRLIQEIENNEILLAGEEDGEYYSLFDEPGTYIYEVSLYEDNTKLTSVYGEIPVRQEQIVIGDDIVEPYLPVFDELMQDISTAITETNNLNISAEKVDTITTISITNKDGETTDTQIIDGVGLEYNWNNTSLGIKREDEENYSYVNLKGDKGDPGAIKMLIVNELPETGADDTIYLVPITPDISGNNYAEYIYINNAWELLGKIGVQVDLSNYVKNTDYATSSVGGVLKPSSYYGSGVNNDGYLYGETKTYSDYSSGSNGLLIGKGTLENVITGKDLTTKSYVDGLVGDINDALDSINGESV